MDGMRSPISAALLSTDGRIQALWQLETNAPPRPIPEDSAYLLEMHSTWFLRHQIKRDMRVLGIRIWSKDDSCGLHYWWPVILTQEQCGVLKRMHSLFTNLNFKRYRKRGLI